ncbi:unnamed protein product [Pleuronectes platessa]|uniref:Splicing factor 3B subunit 4 n=1 Tax=Pleuronectes platessa TaxID=8262 RepID=A0A9N7Y724_PLEPL|nr:unnamed protein product [Pleuronectes platessa]
MAAQEEAGPQFNTLVLRCSFNMAAGPISERNQDATVYVGGLDEKVSEPLLWELFLQAGPVVNTHMPKDRVTGQHQGYGFVEFLSEEDADYAIKIMNMIKLYGKPIRVNKASAHNKNLDVGANIFIGNLDPEIDEKLLYDTFSAFGVILQTPKIMRDPDTGNSKGYAFINFASFDASDAAIEAMNGQYLCNRPITVSYAFKKDSKGERHGSAAERLLAAQNPLSQADRPHQLFADAPPPLTAPTPVLTSMGGGMSMQGMPPPGSFPPVPPPGSMPPSMPPSMSMSMNAGGPGQQGGGGGPPPGPPPFPPGSMHPGMPQMPMPPPAPPGMVPAPPGSNQRAPLPPGMPPPPMGMPPRAPYGHPMGMRGPPPMPPPGYGAGPPRPPPFGFQRGPPMPPRPPAPHSIITRFAATASYGFILLLILLILHHHHLRAEEAPSVAGTEEKKSQLSVELFRSLRCVLSVQEASSHHL